MPTKKKSKKSVAPSRVGRPRANQTKPDGPVREEILSAARSLFRANGFKGTSTRDIADRAGLRQPSLFHYFKNKGEIFAAVAIGAVQPVLEFLNDEAAANHLPEVALYRLVYFDTYHLCTNENVIGSPFQFPELTREQQPEFWERRDRIIMHYQKLLDDGVRTGVFKVTDTAIVTQLLFALGESTLAWYRGEQQPKRVAEIAAATALRSVLAEPNRLNDVVKQAR